MADHSTIEWTEATWNPVTGCDKVSQGCKNCYAERLATTRLKHLPEYENGFLGNVQFHPERLQLPLKWKKPRMIFVNSMSDLFHESVKDAEIAAIFAVMAVTPHHTYQILTKRPQRMQGKVKWIQSYGSNLYRNVASDYGFYDQIKGRLSEDVLRHPNVWLGVSIENQRTADERIPLLIQCPAAVRFVSAEPLLGPVDLSPWNSLDWLIVGGESGPGARPMNPAWVRDLRDQCVDSGVRFFFKQWGGRFAKKNGRELDGRTWDEMPHAPSI